MIAGDVDASASPSSSVARAPPLQSQASLLSVVIVTADSGLGIVECVARALASHASVEVLVVDNASRDGSIEHLAAQFVENPQVRILHNATNVGFGAGCNRGAALARGDLLVLLNPDCMVDASTLPRLQEALCADAKIGLIGALQVDAAGRVDPASRRRDPHFRRAVMRLSGLSRHVGNDSVFAGFEIPSNGSALEAVDAVSGALMMLPRRVFERLQGFDEGYFLHCEDLDLCRRVRDAGFSVVCANDVRVMHRKGGSSQHRAVFVAWHKHRGMWRWFTKFDPAARNPLTRAVVYCGLWAHFAGQVPRLLGRRLFGSRAA